MSAPPEATAVPTVRCLVGTSAVSVLAPHPEDHADVRAIFSGFPSVPEHAEGTRVYAVHRVGDERWEIHANGVRMHQTRTRQSTRLALEWQVVTDMLEGADRCFHLHGSALLDPTGTLSVLVLGESGVGKTTMTLALMTREFLPYTDDVVLIDPGTLAPATFRRAFHVDMSTRALMADLPHATDWEAAGLPDGYFMPSQWATHPAPVGAIFFPKRHDAEKPLLVSLSVAEAATALVPFSGTLDRDPALTLRMAARLTASAPSYALYPGPLPMTADFLDGFIARLADQRARQS